ncbi:efflux RND transporter periplasmic adaptor subunit [Pantoea sp. 18069]|uniref:efflux RND transporter periplasmic adaptor subunit n=1 Tax=Pantoea sp. 18069 TaxID=2681415 RepID=UPI00190F97A9|nr:efflux RND transporter periplasmic adaptor subunit [Pantoea sp. 18069]
MFSTLAVVAVLAAAGGAWYHWSAHRTPKVEYIYANVQRTQFEDLVSATGALQPRDYVDVGAQVSGQLRKLLVDVGSEVADGQLLAEIDAEQSTAKVDASRASLRAQRAQLVQNEVNLKKAERDLERLRNLLKDDATTLELVQNAQTTVDLTRAQINTQKAQIEQTQASMRVDESNLKYTKIYAPMAGTVVSITAKQGQTLNANQAAPTILRIADQSTMTVQTQVSEADVSKLRAGMPAYFTTLGSQGRRWYGELRKIEPTPTVTNNVVLYNALFDVDNHNGSLMAQMTAQVFFVVAEVRDALVVPMAAVTLQGPQGGRREGASAPAAGAPRQPASAAPAAVEQGRRSPRAEGASADEARSGGSRGEGREGREPRGEGRTVNGEQRQRASGPRNGAAPTPGMPRKATVKVAQEDGVIIEREITIGVSNRVQAQILSGLEEGERVVVGVKQVEAQRRSATAQQPQQGPGGMGPGMGAGAAGGSRR